MYCTTCTGCGAQSGCLSRAYPEIGGPVSLTSSLGTRVTEADFTGRPALVYFGFTYCPDVCPTELQNMTNALDRLGASGVTRVCVRPGTALAAQLQFLFEGALSMAHVYGPSDQARQARGAAVRLLQAAGH